MRHVLMLLVSAVVVAGALGCASMAQKFGGVWGVPEKAIAPVDDPLMAKYQTSIETYLKAVGEALDDDVLSMNLVLEGTRFEEYRGEKHLIIDIDYRITYNTGQLAGQVDTPRKRAEKDFHSGIIHMAKLYPKTLLEADFLGLIVKCQHRYNDQTKSYDKEKKETAEYIWSHKALQRLQDAEITIDEFLNNEGTILVDGLKI